MDTKLELAGQATSEEAIECLVFHEQVKVVCRLTPLTLVASTVGVAILWWILRPISPSRSLNVWFAAVGFVTVVRYILTLTYQKSGANAERARLWVRWFLVWTVIAGLLWGWAGTVLFPVDHPRYQVIIVGIIVAMAAGGLSSLAAVRSIYFAFLVPVVLPFSLYMIYFGAPEQVLTGIAGIVYIGIMQLNANRINRNIAENLTLRFKQASMVQDVIVAQRRTEKPIDCSASRLRNGSERRGSFNWPNNPRKPPIAPSPSFSPT